MAITVNYYPRMDNIAQTAYGGGQTAEGIRQQNFGLNVEQLAQRERMQNQDIGFRQGAQLFDAQVGMAQQARGIAANQQSQMYAQAGRERLAVYETMNRQQELQQQINARNQQMMFGAAQDAEMQRRQQQGQMNLLQAQQEGRINEFKQQLDMQGQAKVAEHQRRVDIVNSYLNRGDISEQQWREAMSKLDSEAAQTDLSRYIVKQPTIDELWANNSKVLPDGSVAYTGDFHIMPPPKVEKNAVGTWYGPDGMGPPEEVSVGAFRYDDQGNKWQFMKEGNWKLEVPAAQQGGQLDPIKFNDKVFAEANRLSSQTDLDGKPVMPFEKALEEARKKVSAVYGDMQSGGMSPAQPQQSPQPIDYGSQLPEPDRTDQTPKTGYGTAIPPAGMPPKTLANGTVFSRDGKFVYAADLDLRGMDEKTWEQLKAFFPTVSSPSQELSIPPGTLYNKYDPSTGRIKIGVLREDNGQ